MEKFELYDDTQLKAEAKQLHELIYEIECYGVRDMIRYDRIIGELARRGCEPKFTLTF